jgi:transposase
MMPLESNLGAMDRESVIQSLREGWRLAEHFKAEAERLQQVNEALEAELRAKHRSATPFSKNRPKPDPQAPGRKPGQGSFQRRVAPIAQEQDQLRSIDVPLDSTTCPNCGQPLELRTETATSMDLPAAPQRIITTFNVQIGHCPHCQRDVRGTHPELPPDQQGATAHRVGDHCKAVGISLHYGLGVPQRKVPLILKMLTGIDFSQSALVQSIATLCAPGAPAHQRYAALRQQIRTAPVVNTDDTGWKVGGQISYLMGFFTQTLAVYQIRPRHTNEEVREMLGIDFGGLLGTDRGPSYDAKALDHIPMQKCLSHLLKNISQAAEGKRGPTLKFMRELQALLREAIKLWQQQQSGELDAATFQQHGAALSAKLSEHLHPRKFKDAEAQRLLEGIGQRHDHGQVLLFLERPEIEPTNNRAERGLRGAIISRKVSQCSKNTNGSERFSILKSITETLKLQGESLVNGIAALFQAQRNAASGR